jgi:NAD(P)-dependent dehydrogenase (short-subunit alcohol dehydrogenase family)
MTLPAVLVTGGARRIGAAIARRFGEEGWHVVIHCNRSFEEAEKLAASLPSAETVRFELTDTQAALTMVEALAARLADWRVLVNCASVFADDDTGVLDVASFDRTMRVNAATPTRIAQAFLAHAKAKGGRRVIDVTDQKTANPNPDFFSYTMSKHALAATVPMLAAAASWGEDRVYALAPGAILPSFDQSAEEFETAGKLNLLERLTDIEEVADAALFLAQGWLASGATLFVDSGQHLLSQKRDVMFLARESAGA